MSKVGDAKTHLVVRSNPKKINEDFPDTFYRLQTAHPTLQIKTVKINHNYRLFFKYMYLNLVYVKKIYLTKLFKKLNINYSIAYSRDRENVANSRQILS